MRQKRPKSDFLPNWADIAKYPRKLESAGLRRVYEYPLAAATLTRNFKNDPLYRLISATGRESKHFSNSATPHNEGGYVPAYPLNTSGTNVPAHTRAYTRLYTYDHLGNMLKLEHNAGTGASFNRYYNDFDTAPSAAYQTANVATKISYGGNDTPYTFDVCGNMLTEGSSRHFEYDAGDVLRAFYVDSGAGTEPSVFTHYLYDAGGNRVKKITRKSTGNPQVSLYIDGAIDTYYELDGSLSPIEIEQEFHIMDGRARVARRTVYDSGFSGTQSIEYKYNLEDHLGTSSCTLDDNGAVYSREEYFPFGETSFGSFAKKRYRYCGKERDEESGLYYYGARYYAAWTCRFVNLDPLAGSLVHQSPFCYAGNSPVTLTDVDGLAPGGLGGGGPGGGSSQSSPPMITPQNKYNNLKIPYPGNYNPPPLSGAGGTAETAVGGPIKVTSGDYVHFVDTNTKFFGNKIPIYHKEYVGDDPILKSGNGLKNIDDGLHQGSALYFINTTESVRNYLSNYIEAPALTQVVTTNKIVNGLAAMSNLLYPLPGTGGIEANQQIFDQLANKSVYDWASTVGEQGTGVLVPYAATKIFLGVRAGFSSTSSINSRVASKSLQNEVRLYAEELTKKGHNPSVVVGMEDLFTGRTAIGSSFGPIPKDIAEKMVIAAEKVGGVGAKYENTIVGQCAEFKKGNTLMLLNPKLEAHQILVTDAIRPRTGEIIPYCAACRIMFNLQ